MTAPVPLVERLAEALGRVRDEREHSPNCQAQEGRCVIYRTQWTPRGHFAPEFRDFRYQIAAENYAAILRELGHQHVSTHHLDATDGEKR